MYRQNFRYKLKFDSSRVVYLSKSGNSRYSVSICIVFVLCKGIETNLSRFGPFILQHSPINSTVVYNLHVHVHADIPNAYTTEWSEVPQQTAAPYFEYYVQLRCQCKGNF